MFGKKKKKEDEKDHPISGDEMAWSWAERRGPAFAHPRPHILSPEDIEQMQADWGEAWVTEFRKQVELNSGDRNLTIAMSKDGAYQPAGTVMSEETKQRIIHESGLLMPSGMGPTVYYNNGTGTNLPTYRPLVSASETDVDALWEKMYVKMRKVIVVCSYCGRPTVISEGNCPKCGAPLPVEFL